MKKILCLVVAVLLAVAVFAGCSGSTEPAGSEDASAQSSASAETVGSESSGAASAAGNYPRGNGDDTLNIGFACMDMSNTFHATVAKYFEQECANRGIECMVLDDKFDGTTATENCQLICDSDCDVYVSVMGFMVGDTLSDICKEAGVLAIGMDQPIPDFPFFGADNVTAGYSAGEALAEAAIEKWGENPTIDLYIGLESLAGAEINDARMHEGMLEGIRSKVEVPDEIYVQCDVTNNDSQVAMRWVEDTINAHPEAEHILIGGFVDDSGQGAEAVIEKLGYQDKALIGTVDGSTLAINNFKNPDTAWVCSAALLPEMYGYYMLETLEPYLKGETDELPDSWNVPPVVITKDDYEQVLTDSIIYDDYQVG